MSKEIADVILANIDDITKRWVDVLRQSPRTEIHGRLLSSEIVDGVKAMLANLTSAIEQRESPDGETTPVMIVPHQEAASTPLSKRLHGTKPFGTPLQRAQQAAAMHGKRRHIQGYEFHEVILEYVKLRQVIWEMLQAATLEWEEPISLDVVQYTDRLLDELMLTTTENYYNASVRDLETRATRDPLTQLYNKDYFQQRLSHELRRALRYSEPLTVALMDMDRLKTVNDTYGHPAGDAVIVAVASALKVTARQPDVPCRIGGDEFAVILPETSKEHATIFAERALQAVQNLVTVVAPSELVYAGPAVLSDPTGNALGGLSGHTSGPLEVPVPTLSIGMASFPEDAREPETLVARADAALYRAKREGRNQIISYNAESSH